MENVEDISNLYLRKVGNSATEDSVRNMEAWAADFKAAEKGTFQDPYIPLPEVESRPLPAPKPARTKTDDSLGRPQPEGENDSLVQQVLGGVDDAARNSLGFLDPITNWLNENVADLRYDKVATPKTATGNFTRKISEFMTGFIPAIRALRAVGMTGNVAAPMLAGAIADFTVRDPHEGRLADIWKEAGLPKNVLTDFLASDPGDSEMEGRFKNAAEGVLTGAALEAVMLGARTLRAARSQPGVKQSEEQILKQRYGEVPENVIDSGAPVIASGPKGKFKIDERSAAELSRDLSSEYGARVKVEEVGDQLRVAGISVPEAEQGKGIGSKILKQIKDYADKTGRKVTLTATPRKAELQERLNKFYEDNGFKQIGRDPLNGQPIYGYASPVAALNPSALIRGRKGEILSEDFEVFVNFARIDEPKQVQFVIGKMAEAAKGQIDEATRGTITQAETKRLADDMGMTVSDLLSRRKGQPLNAEEAVAARTLWASSAEKLLELAKKASHPNAGALDQFAFRRQMAIHSAIQSEVIGARTETARALASWRIDVDGNVSRARAIKQIMDASGGDVVSKEMATRLTHLAENGADAATIGRFAERGMAAASVDAIKEVWVNGLLSSPKTHVVNVMSNTLVAFQQIYERAAASGIRNFIGGEGVVAGESAAMTFGLIEGLKDAFRMSAKALRTGESQFASVHKLDLPTGPKAVSSQALQISGETGLGRAIDFIGTVTNVPGRLLQAEDEFFKTIGYRMELHAQALRTGVQEGFKGEELARRVAEITRNPPEHVVINAADAALYNTFTNEMGSFGRAVMNMRNIDHPANPLVFILPFIRTPVNIARYAFERTPFAPLVAQWRADIAAGGARADLALARMSTGTAIMAVAMDLADSGIVSGKGPSEGKTAERESLQRQGWQPYSIKVGDRWYSYNRADPFGMTMGFAADIAEAVRRGEINDDEVDEWHEAAAMAIMAVSQVTISKTYLEGFANLIETMMEPQRRTKQYVEDLIASFLPATSLMSAVKNVVDPVRRETGSPADAVRARIAGLSENLPPRRNLWGEEISTESGLGKIYDFMSPVSSRQQQVSPIDRELQRLGGGPERINKRTTFSGAEVNFRHFPRAYDDYTRLSGNDLKHPAWGMGAKDFLNAVVSGNHPMSASYKIMSDSARKAWIQSVITDYRTMAQRDILANPQHAGFAKEVEYLRSVNANNRLPVLGE